MRGSVLLLMIDTAVLDGLAACAEAEMGLSVAYKATGS